MPVWSEVFVDDGVREVASRSSRRLTIGFGVTSALLVALAPLVTLLAPDYALVVAFVSLAALSLFGAWVVHRLHPVQRLVWHVELSIREAVCVDVQGFRHAVLWPRVERLDLTDEGLTFVTRTRDGMVSHLRVPAEFSQFAAMSHRAAEYAEALGRPIFVDGKPWESVDLLGVFPFLGSTSN